MTSPQGTLLVGQSGGPTAVINQSLVGVIEAARARGEVRRVLGARRGIAGLLEGDLVDLSREDPRELERVANTPCAALRSVRKKPSADECARALARLEELDVRWFCYIGGNDTAETAHILDAAARRDRYDLALIHVPKTIDNDLEVTDHCPGFGSAARFVALAVMGDNLDNRSLGGVKIDVIMGRHAGWLTAASLLAKRFEDDGPHLVYPPEVEVAPETFEQQVREVYQRFGRCVVAVSEGIHAPAGRTWYESGEIDPHGNQVLSGSGALGDVLASHVKKAVGSKVRVRADTFGYLQRAFVGVTSPSDALEAREVGRRAVGFALDGSGPRAIGPSGTVVIERLSNRPYAVRYRLAPLEEVAQRTRRLPAHFLTGVGAVAESFVEYAAPLVGELPDVARLAEHPFVPGRD
jgi:6-phosphofructokinase 1